jgi:hypothetical protein
VDTPDAGSPAVDAGEDASSVEQDAGTSIVDASVPPRDAASVPPRDAASVEVVPPPTDRRLTSGGCAIALRATEPDRLSRGLLPIGLLAGTLFIRRRRRRARSRPGS